MAGRVDDGGNVVPGSGLPGSSQPPEGELSGRDVTSPLTTPLPGQQEAQKLPVPTRQAPTPSLEHKVSLLLRTGQNLEIADLRGKSRKELEEKRTHLEAARNCAKLGFRALFPNKSKEETLRTFDANIALITEALQQPRTLLPLLPLATEELRQNVLGQEDRAVLQGYLTKLQAERQACSEGKRALPHDKSQNAVLAMIDENIKRIQARIVTLLAYELIHGEGTIQGFFETLSSISPPIDDRTKQSLKDDLQAVCGSAAAHASLPELQQGIERLWPAMSQMLDLENLLVELEKNATLSVPVRDMLERCINDFKIFQEETPSLDKLSDEGLRRFVEIEQGKSQTPAARKQALERLKEEMQRRGGFEEDLSAIDKALQEISAASVTRGRSVSAPAVSTRDAAFKFLQIQNLYISLKKIKAKAAKPKEVGKRALLQTEAQELVETGFGRLTVDSPDARKLALTLLKEIRDMHEFLETRQEPEAEKTKQMLEEMVQILMSSQWFKGVVENFRDIQGDFLSVQQLVLNLSKGSTAPAELYFQKIQDMAVIAKNLGSDSKIVMEGGAFVLGERETGIKKFMSQLLGRGTGWSKESKDTALSFLSKMQDMMAELANKGDRDSQNLRKQLQTMLEDLASSEWFRGAIQHHPEVSGQFYSAAERILGPVSEDNLAAWTAINIRLEGSVQGISDAINGCIKQRVREVTEQDITDLKETAERLSRLDKPGPQEVAEIEQGRDRVTRMAKTSQDSRVAPLLQDFEGLYQIRVLPYVGKQIQALQERLQSQGVSTNDVYEGRIQIDSLLSKKYPEEVQLQLQELKAQYETKIVELGESSITLLSTPPLPEQEMVDKARQEFRTCFRNLSLVGRQPMKQLVEALPEGKMRTALRGDIRREERRWALKCSLQPRGVRESLSEREQEKWKAEQQTYQEFNRKKEEAKAQQANKDKASAEGRTIKLPDPPSTPMLDVIQMAEDFQTQSTARIAPYFKDRNEFFTALEDLLPEVVLPDERRALIELLKRVVREQQGSTVSPQDVQKKIELIANTLGSEVFKEIQADLQPPLTYTTETVDRPQSAEECSTKALEETRASPGYQQAVGVMAQDLFAHTAVAFLNDSIADIRLAQSPKYNQYLSQAGVEIKNFAIKDILSSSDPETAQKKCQFWLDVAEECRKNGNLTGLAVILGALQDAGIAPIIPSQDSRFEAYRAQLVTLLALVSTNSSCAQAREYQRARLRHDPPLPVIPMLVPFDIDFEHVGENTPHDKGEVVEKIALEMQQIQEGLKRSIPQGSVRQGTNLSTLLPTVKEQPGRDLVLCKFVPSPKIRKRIMASLEGLKQGTLTSLPPESMAAIDLDEALEFTDEGRLVPKTDDKGVITQLKSEYKNKIMERARANISQLTDSDPAKRQEAIQDLEAISSLLTPKSRQELEEEIRKVHAKSDVGEAVYVLDLFAYAQAHVQQLSDVNKCQSSFETLKRFVAKLPEAQRKALKEQLKKTALDEKVKEGTTKFFDSL